MDIASRIMPRTTVNIDAPILRDVRRMQKREGKPLGRLISELLGEALAQQKETGRKAPTFRWISRPLHARVDLTDKEAVRAALEQDEPNKRQGR